MSPLNGRTIFSAVAVALAKLIASRNDSVAGEKLELELFAGKANFVKTPGRMPAS